jgi:hypothetical protein
MLTPHNQHCTARRKDGSPCKARANGSGLCFTHNPRFESERVLARRNGGLSLKKPHNADASKLPSEIRSMEGVFAVLNYALQESLVLDNSVQRGRLLVSVAHGYIEALKVGERQSGSMRWSTLSN